MPGSDVADVSMVRSLSQKLLKQNLAPSKVCDDHIRAQLPLKGYSVAAEVSEGTKSSLNQAGMQGIWSLRSR